MLCNLLITQLFIPRKKSYKKVYQKVNNDIVKVKLMLKRHSL